MNEACTRQRLRRMFKYFKNRYVHVRYEYNNSLGHHLVREDKLEYDDFEIVESFEDFNVILSRRGRTIFEQEFSIFWEFIGLGKLQYCNSGPYCYFSIQFQSGRLLEWFMRLVLKREPKGSAGSSHKKETIWNNLLSVIVANTAVVFQARRVKEVLR